MRGEHDDHAAALPALERVLVPAAALRAATATGLLDVMAAGGPRGHAAADLARQCGLSPHRAGDDHWTTGHDCFYHLSWDDRA